MSSVDVVVPCYNYGRFLDACISSIVGQEGVEVRVLIIDDASSDDSNTVGQRLARLDTRIHYRRHEKNLGHINTYNEGLLEWAEADYVLLISADDIVAPGALARAAQVLDANADVGLCFGREVVFFGEKPSLPGLEVAAGAASIIDGTELIEMACDAGDNPVPTPTAVVRTSLQKRVGGYKRELPHTADLDMWLRLAAKGRVGVLPMVQAFKREHSSNMLKQFTPKILPDLRQRLLAFESAFGEIGREVPNGGVSLGKAKQRLGSQAFWGAHAMFERGDLSVVQDLLDFAVQLDPTVKDSRHWRKFVWKRRLGTGVWRVLGHALESMRGTARPGM